MAFLLCLIFFLSGCAALIFETLWFRQAGLTFGSSVWASSLVLTAFMAGVGLGNGLAARYGHLFMRPIRTYAGLELAIGMAGVALVMGLPRLDPLLSPLVRPLLEFPAVLNGFRALLAFLLLLVPSVAMGATLPVVVRALSALDPHFGRVLGRLYGWNTLGAMVGALACEAILIRWVGVTGSAFVAAGLNVLAAALALLAAHRGSYAIRTLPREGTSERLNTTSWRLLSSVFLSGFVLLSLEVLWFRFLVLFMPPSGLAFATMLAVVLAGIGAGGLLAGAVLRTFPSATQWLRPLAWVSGVGLVLTYWLFVQILAGVSVEYIKVWADMLWLGMILMFPISLLSGVFFTGVGAALQGELLEESRTTGLLTLANTAGGALGSMVAGFLLLPVLGMERSFFLMATLYGLTGLLVPLASTQPARKPRLLWVGALLFLVVLALFPFGLMRKGYLTRSVDFMTRQGFEIIAVHEGLNETIQFARMDFMGEPYYYRLITNGYSMAGTSPGALRYMNLFVYWPVALHPDPKSALLISYGVGSTAQALTQTSSLESIDVVDTSRDVLELSRIVRPPPNNPLDDPRVTVHIEDGRHFLQVTDKQFDIITGEPPPPKFSGIVNLYTREYFDLIYNRLAEEGIATYWLPIFELELAETQSVIRAFCDAFSDCSLWQGTSANWMLVGTRGLRGPVSESHFVRQWKDPQVFPTLRTVGIETPEQMGALFVADAEQLDALAGGVPPLEDEWPERLGDPVPSVDWMQIYRAWLDPLDTRERFQRSQYIRRIWPPELRDGTNRAFEQQAVIHALMMTEDTPGQISTLEQLHQLLTETSLTTLPLWLLGSDPVKAEIGERQVNRGSLDPEALYSRAALEIARRDPEAAVKFLGLAIGEVKITPEARLRAYLLCQLGRVEQAEGILQFLRNQKSLPPSVAAEVEWIDSLCQRSLPATPTR